MGQALGDRAMVGVRLHQAGCAGRKRGGSGAAARSGPFGGVLSTPPRGADRTSPAKEGPRAREAEAHHQDPPKRQQQQHTWGIRDDAVQLWFVLDVLEIHQAESAQRSSPHQISVPALLVWSFE